MQSPVSQPFKRLAFSPLISWLGNNFLRLSILFVAGCATTTAPFLPAPLVKQTRPDDMVEAPAPDGDQIETPREPAFFKTPTPPPATRATAGRAPPSPRAPADDGSAPLTATVSLENLPLPQFVNAVFATILKRNVSMDDQVKTRNDMVSLRTGKPQTAERLAAAAKAVLRSYGVVVAEYDGLVRVTADNAQSGALPEIRRGRASPDVPGSLRPVFYLAELEHTNVTNTSSWLRTLFPSRLNVQDDLQRNAILMSGQSDTVAAALEAIQLLDQPQMRGRRSARIAPVFLSADEMAKRLVEMLTAEGYFVAQNAGSQAPLLIIPVGPINSIVVFAANDEILNHTLHWARELDRPNRARAASSGYITYFVRNTDAADLAKTLNEVLTGAAVTPAAATSGMPPARQISRVVVNAAANSLIIQGAAAEFQQLRGLLEELDRPARSALVMATVAEVYLDSSETFNFSWMLKQFSSHGYKYNVGTTNGSGLASAASNFSVLLSGSAGDPRALFSALASDNKVRILSNPSVMARSGETATIQVGTQVPIITSQVSNASTGTVGGSSGILQTVQYVQTGVILKVKPVVHAGGRIDLEVSQEVSSAGANNNGGTTSPIISNKKVDTKLSVSDGNTVLLGGLISEESNLNKSGIPGMKDIPLIGGLFQTSNVSQTTRTELVIMLTSYTMEDDFDAISITEAFRAQFPWAADVAAGTQAARSSLESKPLREKRAAILPATAASLPRSQPYQLPEQDTPVQLAPNVAPIQHSTEAPPPMTEATPLPSAPFVVNSSASTTVAPPAGIPVTDSKLKQELLEAIRRDAGAKKP